jgi:hypothetical protein
LSLEFELGKEPCAGKEIPVDALKAPILLEVVEDRGYTRHRQRDRKSGLEPSRFKDDSVEGAVRFARSA